MRYTQSNEIKSYVSGEDVNIQVQGRFTFESHKDFRKVTTEACRLPNVKSIAINFSSTTYIDSAALGMLLMLRDVANGNKKSVKLTSARGDVLKVLEIANFSKLFEIQ